ncbi:hypothetical protein JG687_00008610 [Phytophthora cactorum]|uniref:G-protein beta WD-40 repeat n=1 Tax=Phytophthora cactorum TaxID=29920 RepID=A0A8T1UGE9_9STRA|nr:hypothetical protein JG687_00008610 [Phytophthora cactorum]
MASKSGSGNVRLEEYASSGLVVESEDVGDALSRLKVRSTHSGEGGDGDHGPARVAHSASASHRQNDRYMEAFDTAFEELSATEAARTGVARHAIGEASFEPSSGSSAGKMTRIAAKQTPTATDELIGAWIQGPCTPEGDAHAVSAQPLMCMSMSADESEVVVGSSDHALYVVPISNGSSSSGVKCEDLLGHSGSVSCVLSLNDEMALSAGYDKMLRLWNVSRRASSSQREVSVVKAGTAPILDVSLLFEGQRAVCGDRDGGVQLIDLQTSKILRQDGAVKVWDSRQKGAAFLLELHIDPRSGKKGAVGFLREPMEDANVLITAGADGVINVLDKRQLYGVVYSFTEHLDFIYSLHVRSQLCFSGAGNGMLHVHDWKTGKLLYGLGANQAAVRAIEASTNQLVAAGDDGGVIVYDMK